MTLQERFDSHVIPEPNSGCFLWDGHCGTTHGYGLIYVDEPGGARQRMAHRVAWVLAGRDLPKGAHLCHKCDTPCCVNVDHLFIGDAKANIGDMARKGRGRKGRLPFGVSTQKNGRFQAQYWNGEKMLCFGTYDTAEEASAVSLEQKRLHRGGAHGA